MDNSLQGAFGSTEEVSPSQPLKNRGIMIAILVFAPLLTLFLVAFVFQTYEVEGVSMHPTLSNQDRLMILKAPVSWAKITGKSYAPHRYDIVVFNRPGESKQLIKRVIGLPGERVVIDNHKVTIYNSQHPQGFLVDRQHPDTRPIRTSPGYVDEVVSPNHLFVMGDNRANSLDSSSFGAIKASDVAGQLILRVYPLNKFELF